MSVCLGSNLSNHACAVVNGVKQLTVNDQALRRAWESSQRSTKEDWAEWMRHFAVELLKESPSHALRATHLLAQVWDVCFPLCCALDQPFTLLVCLLGMMSDVGVCYSSC